MTYEPMHSAQAQSVRVIVTTLHEVKINVYFIFDS